MIMNVYNDMVICDDEVIRRFATLKTPGNGGSFGVWLTSVIFSVLNEKNLKSNEGKNNWKKFGSISGISWKKYEVDKIT